jgi:hypothetical protein
VKRSAVLAGLGAAALLACAASLALGDAQPRFETSSTYLSKYIWRGFTNSAGSVAQNDISVGFNDFTLNVWGNYDAGDSKRVNEVDYTLDYTKRAGIYNYSLGYTYYTFPNTRVNKTQELYFGITNSDSEWSPALTVYHDFDEGKGTYATLSVSHNLTESRFPARFTASVGYNSKLYWRKSGFSDAVFSLSVPVKVSRNLAVVPTFWYSAGLDSDFKSTFFTGLQLAWGQ